MSGSRHSGERGSQCKETEAQNLRGLSVWRSAMAAKVPPRPRCDPSANQKPVSGADQRSEPGDIMAVGDPPEVRTNAETALHVTRFYALSVGLGIVTSRAKA